MPAFTLYGGRGSTNTDRVRLTLAEGGFTDYELVLVNLQKGEHKVGGPFVLEGDAAFPCVRKLYIRIEPQNLFSLLKYLFPCPQGSIYRGN
jgi:hypothetical protein